MKISETVPTNNPAENTSLSLVPGHSRTGVRKRYSSVGEVTMSRLRHILGDPKKT